MKKLKEKTEQELLINLVIETRRTNKMINLFYVIGWIQIVALAIWLYLWIISRITGAPIL